MKKPVAVNPGRDYSNIAHINEGILAYIQDYDPNTHKVKIIRFKDGEPPHLPRTYQSPVEKVKQYEIEDKRVLKVGDDPKGPIIESASAYVRMGGNSDNGFFSYKDGGNFIKGPLSLIMKPDDIRLSALSKLNPLIITGFPSTIVTPLPTCIWSIPGSGAIKPILEGVLMATTLLAATGAA